VDSFLEKAHQYTVVKSYEDPAVTGFAAIAIEGPEKGTVTVAARGTQFDTIQDVAADIQLGVEHETMQQRAMNHFMEDLKSYDSVYLTGHSLGGNLAVSGAVGFDKPSRVKGVITFNAPGQNAAYLVANDKEIKKVKSKITNYQNEGDFVSDINVAVGEIVVVKSKSGDKSEFTSDFRNHSLDDMKYTKDGFKVSKNGKNWTHNISKIGSTLGFGATSLFTGLITVATPGGLLFNTLKNYLRDEVIESGAKQNVVVKERIFIDPEGLRIQAACMQIEQANFDIVVKKIRNLVVTLKEEHVWESPATDIFVENYLNLHENFIKFSEGLKEYARLMQSHSNGMENLDQHLANDINKISL